MEEKKQRTIALSNFTRNLNSLKRLMDDSSPSVLVTPQFEKFQACWVNLETCQERFLAVADIDIEKDEKDGLKFIDGPDERYQEIVTRYSAYLKTCNDVERAEIHQKAVEERNIEEDNQKRIATKRKEADDLQRKEELRNKFISGKAEFKLGVGTFKRRIEFWKDSVSDATVADIRCEWSKVEEEFKDLKNQLVKLVGTVPEEDVSDLTDLFVQDAEEVFTDLQKWVMSELKAQATEAPSPQSSSSTPRSSSSTSNTTKREPVTLPDFIGDDKESPFLKYPVWRKQWQVLILEYEEKWRAGLLWDHLDDIGRSRFVGYENDYEEALKRLDAFYAAPYKVVSCVIKEVMSPQNINEGDYKALLSYSTVLENNLNRLKNLSLEHEISNTSSMYAILRKFPRSVAEKWSENLASQTPDVRAKPFPQFIEWLISQKVIWEQMASMVVPRVRNQGNGVNASFFGEVVDVPPVWKCYGCGEEGHKQRFCPKKNDASRKKKTPSVKKFWCAYHKGDSSKRCSSISCESLRKLEDVPKRIQLLQENGDCHFCCGDHKPDDCTRKDRVCGGGRDGRGCNNPHKLHELFCRAAKVFAIHSVFSSNADGDVEGVVLSIMNVGGCRRMQASVFWDLGSNCNFVREGYAKASGFKGVDETLSVTTLGGVVTDYLEVKTYSCCLKDVNGVVEWFKAYGLESITGTLTPIKLDVVKRLFPHLDDKTLFNLKRASGVDFLIGMKHPSWHPERAERAGEGGDLWLYRGKFGVCIGGRHSLIKEGTQKSSSLFTVNHTYHSNVLNITTVPPVSTSHELEFCPKRSAGYLAPDSANTMSGLLEYPSDTQQKSIFQSQLEYNSPSSSSCFPVDSAVNSSLVDTGVTPVCFVTKGALLTEKDMFFQLESLGTMIDPQCGGCRCSKCPLPGSKYSFKEQKEFDTIQGNLFYNDKLRRWFTKYPWICLRSILPRNEKKALQVLIALERRLSKDPVLAEEFCKQIQAMVDRGVAIIFTNEQLASWEGDFFYLPLVGVRGKVLRVCFDAARKYAGFPSMNECLLKGPDRFINNLLSVILGFRNGRVGCAGDIIKFHNQVHLVEEDVHMQRFLWRDMKTDSPPKTYAVAVNNFGVKPANCIATCALHLSADKFAKDYPIESEEVKNQTYVDDELTAAPSKEEALVKTQRWDRICNHAGMPNKGWTYTGDEASEVEIGGGSMGIMKVLGLSWVPKSDFLVFNVKLSFLVEPGGESEVDIHTVGELESHREVVLTRRSLLSNIKRIFDPAGLLAPFTLLSKLLMRETWSDESLGWDDDLPVEMRKRWLGYLKLLLKLNEARIPRSLWPKGDIVGKPMLIIFSDGSISAYGVAAYIRWQLYGGGYWSRLIMSKSKISPKRIVSIPRMELCGAVVGNRIKNFLLKETNFSFEKVYHLVDSSTVLGYVHKECGVFGPYEGVRVAEIQSSNEFQDGRLKDWAWVPGAENPADWCTKPRTSSDIGNDFFYSGPSFLKLDETEWPIKWSYKVDKLEGEVVRKQVVCSFIQKGYENFLDCLVERSSSWTRLVRVMAWLLRFGFPTDLLDCEDIRKAKQFLVKHAQAEIDADLQIAVDGKGRFCKLAPIKDQDGIWRVGSRMRNRVPFTVDSKMPKILPAKHALTLLIMRFCHEFSHAGQDGTLSRFRSRGYWAVRAGSLAKSVKQQCVTCRKIQRILLFQPCGEFPDERLLNTFAWGYVQLDLFGPFSCRGDVNPRTTKKTWGMIIVDCNSGAVHLDIVQDYSTNAVLLTLRRFGSLRGWPGIICSDPGSQLESASGKLDNWWLNMEHTLRTFSSTKNFKWEVSPPDSPWRQGKAERRIGIVKKLVKISVGDSRLTPVELQTILFEVANICNERPIGLSKPREDGTYTLITPNHLLLGRSSNVLPDDADLASDLPMNSRYRLVQHVTSSFWKQWAKEVSPGLVHRPIWHKKGRNLQIKDVVMICEASNIKAKYRLAVVEDVKVSDDGCVRSATLRYALISKGTDAKIVRVRRSVQRLSLILPVEEQIGDVAVKEHEHYVECCTQL